MSRAMETFVGDAQHGVDRVAVAAEPRHPVADSDLDQPPDSGFERTAGDGRPNPLADHAGSLERRLWQRHYEFLSARARDIGLNQAHLFLYLLYPRDRTVA